MKIHITGDTHGEQARFYDLHYKHIDGQWTKDDMFIVCGDFGYIFLNNLSENSFLNDLERQPYTICFIDGNHECFPGIYSYPVIDFYGGKVHQIRKNIFHLMRGQVFDIKGKTFFTMGGAYSIDKANRTENFSWWKDELPCNEEYNTASDNLKAHNMKVDYILTHTMPQRMIIRHGYQPDYHDSELTGYLEWIYENVSFNHWYCGHWHDDKEFDDNFSLLWFDIKEIETSN